MRTKLLIVVFVLLSIQVLFGATYYVASNGSDSNNGTSKATPWLHSQKMPNCSGTCASTNLAAGDIVIFRGGDTWHFGISTDSAGNPSSGGTLNFNTPPYPSGTNLTKGSGAIYYGVDQTWYSGGSWTRPIFTGDNPVCNASTLGSNCHSGTYPGGFFYVDTCAHQIGTSNVFIEMGGNIGYFIIDNIEFTGLCLSAVGQPGYTNNFINYNQTGHPDQFSNNYFHGHSHLQFAAANGSAGCTSSVVCFDTFVFQGYVNALVPGEIINNNVIDFSDSDGIGVGFCYCGAYETYDNIISYTSQGIPRDIHEFFNNQYINFFENGHSNVIEDIETSPAGAIFNNVFAHIETTGGTNGVLLWPGPVGATDVSYVFNNLADDVGAVQYLNLGGLGITTNNGNYRIFNNTFQTNVNQPIVRANGSPLGTVNTANNHYIDDGTVVLGTGVTTSVTNLTRTNAQATSDGYTSAETYAYSPPSVSGITVGAGTNEGTINQAWCTAMSTAGLTNAAAACQAGTTYACTYNQTNHTVSCPALTANARSTSAAWDIGAYQFAQPPGSVFTLNTITTSGTAVH